MALNNPWVGYITRSYTQIKSSVLSRLGIAVPEITDHSSSNIMVVIIDIFAGISEMLNYYIDSMAREAFISTARLYSSVVKLSGLVDYRIKAAIPAQVELTISFLDIDGLPYATTDEFILPQGTIFNTNNAVEFISIGNITVPVGTTILNVPCLQGELQTGIVIGTTDGSLNQIYSLGTDYANDTIDILVGGEVWTLKSTLGRSTSTDKDYVVNISESKVAYIQFGDGINGAIPTAGKTIVADFTTTLGSKGNVGPNTITVSAYDFSVHNIVSAIITNNIAAVAGTDYEDIEKIRRSAPLSLRTLDRAVTKQDYIDIAKLAPGIDKANIKFNCGKSIEIYVVPNGGGIAPQSLLNTTKDFIDLRKMITTFVTVLPTGESRIRVDLVVRARFRASLVQTEQDIIDALVNAYSYDTSDVNKPIRTSDIIALVDNLDKVDYLTVNSIYLMPYFRPTESSTVELAKYFKINKGSIVKYEWELKTDGTFFTLFREGQQIATIPVGVEYTDPLNILTIKILASAYLAGMVWEFTTYPFNANIELDNFSIPIITSDDILLNITETLTL